MNNFCSSNRSERLRRQERERETRETGGDRLLERHMGD